MINFPRYNPESLQLMIVGRVMKSEWESMTIDDLFTSHEQIVAVLRARLVARGRAGASIAATQSTVASIGYGEA